MRWAGLACVLLVTFGNRAIAPGSAGGQDSPAEQQATARLAGRVVDDATGRGLRGARVVLTGPRNVRHATTTNGDGAFLFKDLPPGRFRVSASRTGFTRQTVVHGCAPQPAGVIELTADRSCEDAIIALLRGGVLTGWVVDEFNEPVVEARVRACRPEYFGGQRRFVSAGSTDTDNRGHFRIPGLQPERYYVAATFGVFDEAANVESGQATAWMAGGSGFALTFYPGTLSSSTALPVQVTAGQDSAAIRIPLIPARLARITGTVAAPSASTYAVLLSSARPDGVLMSIGGFFNVGADGRFTIPNVPPGAYRLDVVSRAAIEAVARSGSSSAARAAGTHHVSVPITIAGEDVADVVLTPGPGFTVAGRLVADDETVLPDALHRVTIQAVPAIGASPHSALLLNATAPVADDGTFELDRVAGHRLIRVLRLPGGWTLKSVASGSYDITDTGLDVARDVTDIVVTLTSRVSSLSGDVRRADGTPAAHGFVVVFPQAQAKWALTMNRYVKSAPIDPDGRFNVPDLPPGDYLALALSALEPGEWAEPARLETYRPLAVALSIEEGETATLHLRLALEP